MAILRHLVALLLVAAFALSSVSGHGHASAYDDVAATAPAHAMHAHHTGGVDGMHPAPAPGTGDHSFPDDENCCAMGGCGITMDVFRDLASSLSELVIAIPPTGIFRSMAPALEGPPPRSIG